MPDQLIAAMSEVEIVAAESAVATHAALTEHCTRPAGTPPSQCPGVLEYAGALVDSSQEGEGFAGESVPIDLYHCGRCGSTLVVSHGSGGWRLRNQYVRPDPAEEERAAC